MAKTKGSQASTSKSESAPTARVTTPIEIESDGIEVFGSINPMQKIKKKSKSQKSGLTLPVSRIERFLRKGNYSTRVGPGAAVYLTAVLEYMVAEVLELAGNVMKDAKKHRINPRHICLAIKNDAELNELIGNACISQGGVIPNINPVLLPIRTKKSIVNKSKSPKKSKAKEVEKVAEMEVDTDVEASSSSPKEEESND